MSTNNGPIKSKLEQALREAREAIAFVRVYKPPEKIVVHEGCRTYFELRSVVEANERTEIARLRSEIADLKRENTHLKGSISALESLVRSLRKALE